MNDAFQFEIARSGEEGHGLADGHVPVPEEAPLALAVDVLGFRLHHRLPVRIGRHLSWHNEKLLQVALKEDIQ